MLRSSVVLSSAVQAPQSLAEERPLVLVVDPDRSARAVLEVALKRDGFDVWSAGSAEQGLALLERGRTPDVIVLEADLGNGDGFSFCAELRGSNRTAQVPVVLLAKASDQNVSNLAEVVGVDESVQKPAFARDVVSLVRFELVRHRTAPGDALVFHHGTVPPAHLLRALLTSRRSGSMRLAEGKASVLFSEGRVVQASFGERWGVDALVRGLALTIEEYVVRLEPVTVSSEFSCSLRDFVSLVIPRLTRWNLMTMRSLPLGAVLAIDFPRLAQALPSMPDDVNRIVQLFDGRRRVLEVLFDSAFDEGLTLEVSTRLYLMGVIGPLTPGTSAERSPRRAPRLFEPRSFEAEELMRQLFDGRLEIGASDVEPAPLDDGWSAPFVDASDPAGGWEAGPLRDAHFEQGLDEEVAQKLAAFNVTTVVEAKEIPASEKPVLAFAQGKPEADDSLEAAFRSVTGDESAQARPGFDVDPTPPSPGRIFSAEDRQARIITPVLTPQVQPPPLAEATHALTPEGQVVALQPAPAQNPAPAPAIVVGTPVPAPQAPITLKAPRVARDRPAATAVETEDEAKFFAASEATAGLEDTLPSATARPFRRRLGALLAVLTVAAVLLAVGLEWLMVRTPPIAEAVVTQPAAVVAPLEPPVPPAPLVLEPLPVQEPVVEEPVVEDAALDVSESLSEGIRAYQAGNYRKAISVLEQVVSDAPRSVQGWLVLGQARYDNGDPKGAKVAAEQVLAVDPRNAGVHVLLATIAHEAGDKATMRQELETYLSLEPDGPHATEARALLAR